VQVNKLLGQAIYLPVVVAQPDERYLNRTHLWRLLSGQGRSKGRAGARASPNRNVASHC